MMEGAVDLQEYIVSIRRKIHEYPELGFNEIKTQEFITKELKDLGVFYKTAKSKTGVVASIGDNKDKVLAFRADMDGLPIVEENDVAYASKIPGQMHACGHDAHVAMLLGLAKKLRENKDELKASVKLIFQPSEENGNGAKYIMDEGLLGDVKPDAIFGIHVTPALPTGVIGLKYGAMMAGVGKFRIVLKGIGGHAAFPDKSPDVIAIGAELIQLLYTIIPANLDTPDSAVLTIGQVNAGKAFNIMPKTLEIIGTIRTFDIKTRDLICEKIKNITKDHAKACGVEADICIEHMEKPLINNAGLVDTVKEVAARQVGKNKVVIMDKPLMGGEDFSDYLDHFPGCFIFLGTRNEKKGIIHDWHNPKFNIDEEALITGTNLFYNLIKILRSRI